MILAEISRRTKLPQERLRYVLDNDIVSGTGQASGGRGTPRDFSLAVAFRIAVAAAMLCNGFGRNAARLFSGAKTTYGLENAQDVKPLPGGIRQLQIADQIYFRIITADMPDPRWFDARGPAMLDASFKPIGFMTVNLAELRERLLKE